MSARTDAVHVEWYPQFRNGECVPVVQSMTVGEHRFAVVDPEGREVNRLVNLLGTHFRGTAGDMREAFRALILPPKPDEPTGLGAVVEDAEGFTWVRTHTTGYPWHANLDQEDRNCTAVRKYADIAAVRVLSEGVPNA